MRYWGDFVIYTGGFDNCNYYASKGCMLVSVDYRTPKYFVFANENLDCSSLAPGVDTYTRNETGLLKESEFSSLYRAELQSKNVAKAVEDIERIAQERGKTDIVLMSKTEVYRRVLSSYISSELGKHVQEYV